MHLSFLLPLALALIVAYILKNSADEIAYLSACILVVSLVVSLAIAPWQIQLLLLLLVLLSNQRLSPPSMPLDESQEDKKIKLSYRGIDYEPDIPKEEAAEGEIKGKYRGQVWKTATENEDIVDQPTGQIKYRGASVSEPTSLIPMGKDNSIING